MELEVNVYYRGEGNALRTINVETDLLEGTGLACPVEAAREAVASAESEDPLSKAPFLALIVGGQR